MHKIPRQMWVGGVLGFLMFVIFMGTASYLGSLENPDEMVPGIVFLVLPISATASIVFAIYGIVGSMWKSISNPISLFFIFFFGYTIIMASIEEYQDVGGFQELIRSLFIN